MRWRSINCGFDMLSFDELPLDKTPFLWAFVRRIVFRWIAVCWIVVARIFIDIATFFNLVPACHPSDLKSWSQIIKLSFLWNLWSPYRIFKTVVSIWTVCSEHRKFSFSIAIDYFFIWYVGNLQSFWQKTTLNAKFLKHWNAMWKEYEILLGKNLRVLLFQEKGMCRVRISSASFRNRAHTR